MCMWSCLPDVVLEQIYHYLNWNDRRSCSQVCWQWNYAFHSASLWRDLVVKETLFTETRGDIFTGFREEICIEKVRGLIETIGEHIQHIVMKKSSNYYHSVKFIVMMSNYMERSSHYPFSQLQAFEFTFKCEHFQPWHMIAGTGGQVLKELQRLMGNFQGIKHLKFNELMLNTYDAMGVIEHLLCYNRASIEYLEFVNFTINRFAMFSIQQFHNLHTLVLSPQNITEDTALMFAQRTSLQRLVLVQDKYTPVESIESLSLAAWWQIKDVNQRLRVRLLLRGHVPEGIDLLTQENAPVDEIIYSTPHHNININKALELFDEYRLYLKKFAQYRLPRRFGARAKFRRCDASVLYMARECLSLETLIIRERISTATLLLVAHAAKGLKTFIVRKNAVLLKSDWERQPEWNKDFYTWLTETSRSYERTRAEVARLIGQPQWTMMSDKDFIVLSRKASTHNLC